MKILTNYDFNQNQILNVVVQQLAAAPTSPEEGQIYFNTASKRFFYYNGTTWVGSDALDATMTGADIVDAINTSVALIDDDNLSSNVNDAIAKLAGIDDNANAYTLPVATDLALGGIKSGGDVTVDANGLISVNDDSHAHTIANITELQDNLDSKETPSGAQDKATTALNSAKSYTDTALADLVGTAPEVLDTLYELAEALGNDPNFATTIANQIAVKTDKYSSAVGDGVNNTIVVTHNLNTQDAVISIRETASPYALVIADVEFTTLDTITLKFADAPTADEFTVTIIG